MHYHRAWETAVLAFVSMLHLAVALQAAPIVVLRGDHLARQRPGTQENVATFTGRVIAALEAVGAPHDVRSDQNVQATDLAGARLVVLPYNLVEDALVATLRQYTSAGGRLAVFFAVGSDQLPALLGVQRGELAKPAYEGQLDAMRLTPAARQRYPALPATLAAGSWHAYALTPLPGTEVLAEWGEAPRPTRAAITTNAAGIFCGHVLMPGDLFAKGLLLVSLAAQGDPSLWTPVLQSARERAVKLAAQAREQWQRLGQRDDLPAARRTELGQQVLAVTARAGALPPADGAAAAARLALYRAVEQDARELTFKLVPSPEAELRGLWVFAGRPIDWVRLLPKVRDAGLNAIFYRVSRGGSAVYPSALLPQEKWSTSRDELAVAVEQCHRFGIELHAWRVCYHLGSSPKEFRAQLSRDGRVSVDLNGKEGPFANPGDPRNEALELAAIREVADRYDVDGVHLDYIRYTDEPSFDFDYGPVSRAEFEKLIGRAVEHWPADVARRELKLRYEDWLRENVSRLVRTASQQLRQKHPRLCFSAAVWRNIQTHRYTIKQDWPRWLREGWLDLAVPMDYDKSADRLRDEVVSQVAAAAGSTRLAAGLGAWLLERPGDLVEQVQVARAAGADGFVLFSSNAANLDEQLAALRLGACATPARPATRTPRATWSLPAAVARPHQPAALAAEQAAPVEVKLSPPFGTERATIVRAAAELRLVQPETGRTLGTVGKLTWADGLLGTCSGTFTVPLGRFQLQVVGQVEDNRGQAWPLVVRGPLLDGLAAEPMAAEQAKEQPPGPAGGGTVVGLYQPGIGGPQLLGALKDAPGVSPVPLWRLTAEHLNVCRTVVLPQLRDPGPLDGPAVAALRAWVEAGGTLILTHDAVGWRFHPTLFANVGYGDSTSRQKQVRTAAAIGDRPAGWTFEHRYRDHVRLRAQPGTQVLLTEGDGRTPVVVSAAVGKGRVVLSGVLLGYLGDEPAVSPDELALLRALL